MTLYALVLYGIPVLVAAASVYIASKGFVFYWQTIIRPEEEAE